MEGEGEMKEYPEYPKPLAKCGMLVVRAVSMWKWI
jgi:hypothetical protein